MIGDGDGGVGDGYGHYAAVHVSLKLYGQAERCYSTLADAVTLE